MARWIWKESPGKVIKVLENKMEMDPKSKCCTVSLVTWKVSPSVNRQSRLLAANKPARAPNLCHTVRVGGISFNSFHVLCCFSSLSFLPSERERVRAWVRGKKNALSLFVQYQLTFYSSTKISYSFLFFSYIWMYYPSLGLVIHSNSVHFPLILVLAKYSKFFTRNICLVVLWVQGNVFCES